MSKKILCTLFLVATFGTGNAFAALPKLIQKNDFMQGLTNPWDLAFMQDGTMFFTEKCRGLSIRKTDGTVTFIFGANGANTEASDMFCEGQSGVHGIALDPNFNTNHFLYLYMASNENGIKSNRVLKLTLDETLTSVVARKDIIKDIPFKAVANNWGGAGSHSGGRIRISPDGSLFVTTGDNHNGFLPQDLTKLGGKVLRVDVEGNALDNNSPAGADARIYAYGFRNVQGITFHPVTAQPFIAEHGPNHSDEVTPLIAGGNGGWDPKPEAGVTCADNYCGYTSNKLDGTPTPMTDFAKFPDALLPLLVNNDSQGMGPITFLTGPQWQEWDGAMVVGVMGGKRLEVLKVDSQNKLLGVDVPKVPSERPRAIVQGPDGFLYVATDEGNIWQIQAQ